MKANPKDVDLILQCDDFHVCGGSAGRFGMMVSVVHQYRDEWHWHHQILGSWCDVMGRGVE
jgi:hypothetical protein